MQFKSPEDIFCFLKVKEIFSFELSRKEVWRELFLSALRALLQDPTRWATPTFLRSSSVKCGGSRNVSVSTLLRNKLCENMEEAETYHFAQRENDNTWYDWANNFWCGNSKTCFAQSGIQPGICTGIQWRALLCVCTYFFGQRICLFSLYIFWSKGAKLFCWPWYRFWATFLIIRDYTEFVFVHNTQMCISECEGTPYIFKIKLFVSARISDYCWDHYHHNSDYHTFCAKSTCTSTFCEVYLYIYIL